MALLDEYSFLPPFPRSIKILANVVISHLANGQLRKHIDVHDKEAKRFMILCYLYAFHYEIHQLIYLYLDEAFYNSAFLAFCSDPNQFIDRKGEHPLFKGMILPENLSASETLGAGASLERMFPHESLRQVLWIRKLVIETGSFLDEDFNALKL